MQRMYMLNDRGEPVPVGDSLEELSAWTEWWLRSHDERVIACKQLDSGVTVSTVFMGFDLRHDIAIDEELDDIPPLLWQSKVFGGPHNGEVSRYISRDAALVGHGCWVAMVVAAENSTSHRRPKQLVN